MRGNIFIAVLSFSLFTFSVAAQDKENLTDGLEIGAELQAGVADGTTPLWLNANRYGLSSLDDTNGYMRLSAIRDAKADKRDWKWGYGLDVAAAVNHSSTFIVQQTFAELQWKKATVTLGSKQQPVEFKNQELSSGALTFGCNARPIPQARLYIDWFSIPGTNGWWKWKLHGSYGFTTDGNWQESFANEKSHYTGNILYHEKALYWKFGKEDHEYFPLTYELALQMAAQFGGTSYNVSGRDIQDGSSLKHDVDLMTFIHILTASGSDETDGSSKNTQGNHLGSWNMRLTWHGKDWKASARFERFFEDQSMMFIQYGIYDHLLGLDLLLPTNRYVSAFTMEHLSSYNQSGAILHDAAPNIPDKMNGRDNYYNHNLYAGYHHWGQAIGNPLLTSPVYNADGLLEFSNNRVKAWHFGLTGDPAPWLHWRAMATFTRNWGTYDRPLEDPANQQYYMAEVTAKPQCLNGWQFTAGLGLDHGRPVGNNIGAQFTVRRTLKL